MKNVFQGLFVIRQTTANCVRFAGFLVHKGMDEYAGWDWIEHVGWICELTGLCHATLMRLVSNGYVILTDEECSEVWLLSSDYWKATARLLGPA